MTKKPDKYARKASTQIRVGKELIRTSPYLGKSQADHVREIVQIIERQKDDPNPATKEYLELIKDSRSDEAAALRAKGLI